MGSHFHYWIDYNGVAFSIELLESGRTFLGIGERKFLQVGILGIRSGKVRGQKRMLPCLGLFGAVVLIFINRFALHSTLTSCTIVQKIVRIFSTLLL